MELADPFAMPLTSPPFAHGPYRCTNGDCLIVTYRTGHPALEEAVLEALTFEEPLVHCEFMHTEPSTGFLPLFGSRAAHSRKAQGKTGRVYPQHAEPIAGDITATRERRRNMKFTALMLTTAAALFATGVAAQETIAPGANVSVVFDQELPNVPGKSMRAVLVEYGPGAGSPSHRHPSSAFIYARVLEGAIRSKVNDEPERTYRAGESWTEKPGDHHQVSHNASTTEPAKLLAIFVVDTSDRKIVIPDK